MTFTQAAQHLQQRLLLLRAVAWLQRSQIWAAAPLLLLAVLRYTHGLSAVWLLIALLLWLSVALLLAWKSRPEDYAALALWGQRISRGEDLAAAWSFEQNSSPLPAEQAHLHQQLAQLPSALAALPTALPLRCQPRRLATVPVLLLLGWLSGSLRPPQVGEERVSAADFATVKAEAARIAKKPLDEAKLAALTEEEKAAAQALKQSVQDTAAELEEQGSTSAKDLLGAVEARAHEAEKLAAKLKGPEDRWASAALLAALRRSSDSADLADSLAAKQAPRAADAATALADQLQAATQAVEQRLAQTIMDSALRAEPEDAQRLAGKRILDAGRGFETQRKDLALAELRALASDLRALAQREAAAQEVMALAQKLRDAAAQATGQGQGSQLAEVPQSTSSSQGGGDPSAAMGDTAQPSLAQQMEQAQQAQPNEQTGGQQGSGAGGERQQVILSQTPLPPSNAPRSDTPRDPSKPLLLAPVPGQDQEQAKDSMTLQSDQLPPGGKATSKPASGLGAGSATAKLNAAATQQQKATDSKTVTAVSNKSGASSLRQIAGGISQAQSLLTSRQSQADFLSAEEAALDDSTLPPARREQIRRYFTALRKRLEQGQ